MSVVSSGPRIVTVGDNVVDCYPDLGVMYPGGNAVNVAVHARRCGARAAYVGAVGTDDAGRLLRHALTEEGVGTGLVRVEDGPNAYAVVRVVSGNRVFGSGEVGVSRIALREPDLHAAGEADVVHTGECSMVENDLPRLASVARRLSFDFSERPWSYLQAYARYADIAVVSTPEPDIDPGLLAARVAELGPGTVAVTQGPRGATLRVAGRTLHSPAGSGPVVDTLGAGDAFIARLLVGLVNGEQPEKVLGAATRYATETCAAYGAFGYRTALPAELTPSRRSSTASLTTTSTTNDPQPSA